MPQVISFSKKFRSIKIHRRSSKNSGDYSLQKIINFVPTIDGDYILWTHVTRRLFSSTLYLDFIKKYFEHSKNDKSRSAFSTEKLENLFFAMKENRFHIIKK